MKKFALKVRIGRNVIFHKIFEFTEQEKQDYLKKIIERGPGGTTGNLLHGEIEVALIKKLGSKYYHKEFPGPLDNQRSLSSRIDKGLEEFAEKYPDILIAAVIQEHCYNLISLDFDDLPTPCQKTESLVDKTNDFAWDCEIID